MTKVQRLISFTGGFFTLLFGIILYSLPSMGIGLISLVMAFTLLFSGIRSLYYYASMARHMVGGKYSLFYGLILTDLGVCTLMLQELPSMYVVIYLLGIHTFYGVTDIMVALQAVKMKSGSWRLKLLTGVGNLVLGILAIYFWFNGDDAYVVIYIYAAGIVYTGIMRMANAFRRTAVPYIR